MIMTLAPNAEDIFEIEADEIPDTGTLLVMDTNWGVFTERRVFHVLFTIPTDDPPRVICEAADKEANNIPYPLPA